MITAWTSTVPILTNMNTNRKNKLHLPRQIESTESQIEINTFKIYLQFLPIEINYVRCLSHLIMYEHRNFISSNDVSSMLKDIFIAPINSSQSIELLLFFIIVIAAIHTEWKSFSLSPSGTIFFYSLHLTCVFDLSVQKWKQNSFLGSQLQLVIFESQCYCIDAFRADE